MDNSSLIYKNFFSYLNYVIGNHKLSHAYIIELSNYDEDLRYVYDFIKMILLDCSYENMLNSSDYLINMIDNNSYPDLYIIDLDGTNIKKSQLLDLKNEFSNKSLLNGKRVYLIKNADKLNQASGNTLLKFLEEPEDNIVAILLTTNRYLILDTIISRCQILSIKDDSFNFNVDLSMVDLLKCFIKPSDFFITYQFLVTNYLCDKNSAISIFHNIENIFVYYLNSYFLNNDCLPDELSKILSTIGISKILTYLSILEEEIPKLDFNLNFKLWLDSLFSRFVLGG